ncbi:MAG: helix-turn-helix transcriptional regulator [Verrucomicrobia bacterium]|nr:helix-turn-helix transcriptional regulator [Verrucomicrobiota bacterium]
MSGVHRCRMERKLASIPRGQFTGMSPKTIEREERLKAVWRRASHRADRVCRQLARQLKKSREAAGLSGYALALRTGVSRDMINCVERSLSVPGLHVIIRLVYGMRTSVTELARRVERR